MYGRAGLDRFKKAQSLEPFSVTTVNPRTAEPKAVIQLNNGVQKPVGQDAVPLVAQTQVGGGQSTWKPPDWAIEPRPGVYYLDVMKERDVLDHISLDRRRHIFGRQFHTCDFVLDHQSVSRQHAAVVPHKNGSIYVIDLGSAHGTFVANERLTKDTPVELEVGQSLRFAASTRSYILRKNNAALFPQPVSPSEINLPPPPDPSDEEAVLAYNTFLNRHGLTKPGLCSSGNKDDSRQSERAAKRVKRARVTFRDQVGGELVEVVGISDGADVETEPGPLGVKEGSLVGKYESLVQVTMIPKGNEQLSSKENSVSSSRGVTDKLQQVLNKVKAPPKGGIYDDLFGESLSSKVGSSWALLPTKDSQGTSAGAHSVGNPGNNSGQVIDEDDDDLFGD